MRAFILYCINRNAASVLSGLIRETLKIGDIQNRYKYGILNQPSNTHFTKAADQFRLLRKDIIKMDLREWDAGMHWFDLAQNSDRWRAFVNAIMNFRGSTKCKEFLD
jgi:hypothetical protein